MSSEKQEQQEEEPQAISSSHGSRKEINCKNYRLALRNGIFRKKNIAQDLDYMMKTNLKKCLTTIDLLSYGLASMLGASVYVLTGAVMNKRTGPAVFVAYLIAGFIAILNALVYSELACRIPRAGSAYSYSYIVLGEFPAFITGWSMLLEYILGAASITRAWTSILNSLTHGKIKEWTIESIGRLSDSNRIFAEYLDILGAVIITIMTTIACLGVRKSAKLTGFFIFIDIIGLLTISVYMFVYADLSNLTLQPPANITSPDIISPDKNFLPFGVSGLISGAAICFNAYIGFDAISTCAEEAKTPNYSLPRANIVAVFLVSCVAVAASLALTLYNPWYLVSTESPFLSVLSYSLHPNELELARTIVFYFVGTACLIGLSSSLLTDLIAGPRICYAIALDGLLPPIFSYICKPCMTPVFSTVFVGILISILDLVFSVESLADFLSLGTLMAYSITSVCVIWLRYRYQPENMNENGEDSDIDRTSTADLMEAKSNKPGYLRPFVYKLLPKSISNSMNYNQPGDTISVIVFVYIVLNIVLNLVLNFGDRLGAWPLWRIIICSIIIKFMITCVITISCYKQFDAPNAGLFRLPLVPVFPCLTLSVNILLIFQLSWITWVRFFIWCFVGLILYFSYGVWNTYKLITSK